MVTIFIDFDGVFHPTGTCIWNPDEQAMEANDAFRWWPHFKAVLDSLPVSVELVVHSTWRLMWETNAEMFNELPSDMVSLIRDCTSRDFASRYVSIQEYVKAHDIERYVIVDDERNAFPADLENLIVCASNTGVSTQRVQDTLNIVLQRVAALDIPGPSF